MQKHLGSREAAQHVLDKVEKEGAFTNLALAEVLGGHRMDERDKSLATEICYGVVTHKLVLDWMISHAAGRPVDKIDVPVLNILRIGFYQLFYLDRIPAAAACHSTVELAKKSRNKGIAPFVNGVMRGALRQKDSLPWPDRNADEAGFLSLTYSHPRWLVERWLSRYGSAGPEALLAANNSASPLTLRTNTLKTTRQKLLDDLGRAGISARESRHVPEGIVLEKGGGVASLELYRQGHFHIQGESSMLVARALDPEPGMLVLDCCSAPGGKTTHLAELMENRGEITALDIYPHRLKLVEANCRRLGIRIVDVACSDASALGNRYTGRFDRVLLDAPCSGLGVMRRKPDLKWRRQPGDIKSLAATQASLIREAGRATSPGGVLVYSTCTNEPEETDLIIAGFLDENDAFSMSGPSVHLYPHIDGLDGFFICRLLRKK